MMDRQHGNFIFECDACGATLDTDTRDFNEALGIMRRANWRASPIGKDWVHTCDGCAEKTQRDARARRAGRIP